MRRLYRLIARVLIATMVWVPFSAQSAMVGTDEIVASSHDHANRAAVSDFLGRGDVVKQLEAMGVSAKAARERVDAMTQDEVNRLAGNIASVPAGGDGWVWGILILAIIIYLVWYKT